MNPKELAKELVIARISAYFASGDPGKNTPGDSSVTEWTKDAIRIAKIICETLN